MQDSSNKNVCERAGARQEIQRNQTARSRYAVALDAALLILEDVDTLPKSNMPVRLAKVIGHVLDAIYDAEKQRDRSET